MLAPHRRSTVNAERRTKFGCKGEGFVYRCDHMAKSFYDLSEKDILALAISLEEEDGRIYGEFAKRMRSIYPKTADTWTHRCYRPFFRWFSAEFWSSSPEFSSDQRE
jgi:hypothetical protein